MGAIYIRKKLLYFFRKNPISICEKIQIKKFQFLRLSARPHLQKKTFFLKKSKNSKLIFCLVAIYLRKMFFLFEQKKIQDVNTRRLSTCTPVCEENRNQGNPGHKKSILRISFYRKCFHMNFLKKKLEKIPARLRRKFFFRNKPTSVFIFFFSIKIRFFGVYIVAGYLIERHSCRKPVLIK